jgi:RND family efflux transporter MFP subunit
VTRSYIGTIEAVQRVVLSAEITGRVLDVPRREGQRVAKGELLVRIDEEEEARDMGRLQAGLQRLEADLAFWEPRLERDRKLLAGRSISQEQLDETVRRLDSVRAGLRESEQMLAAAGARRGYGAVRAPFAGIIQSVMIHPGELAVGGKPLLELVGERALKAVANVPQVDLHQLVRGRRVVLTTAPGVLPIEGVVDRIYPALDVLSRSATFEVFLPPGEALRPGMVVTMEVFLEEAEGILIVPRQALRRVRGIEGVFIAQDGVAAWRPVETGSAQGRGVSVLSGLVAGDAVIVTPNPQLQEGRAIRVWEGSP